MSLTFPICGVNSLIVDPPFRKILERQNKRLGLGTQNIMEMVLCVKNNSDLTDLDHHCLDGVRCNKHTGNVATLQL